MPYDVLEKKIKAIPESYFAEISDFLDYMLYRAEKQKENNDKELSAEKKTDAKDTYSEGFFDLFGSDPDFNLEEPEELPLEIRKEI